MEASGPIASGLSHLASLAERIWQGYFALAGLREENESLRKTLDLQSRQIAALAEYRAENDRLSRLLDYRKENPGRYVTARVLAWDPGPWFRSIVIGAGSDDGLYLEAAVMSQRGVVGRVTELSPGYAKVLLLTDLSSGVDAFIQRNRVNGLLAGQGGGRMTLEYVRKAEDVRVGDTVVTSGLDGIFPAGFPVGSVTLVDKMSLGIFLRAEVSPVIEIGSLEEVLVALDRPVPLDWMALSGNIRDTFLKKLQE
jgi:rod shape-determining protein MreC